MAKMQKKSMSSPDETRPFSKGKVEIITVEGVKLAASLALS